MRFDPHIVSFCYYARVRRGGTKHVALQPTEHPYLFNGKGAVLHADVVYEPLQKASVALHFINVSNLGRCETFVAALPQHVKQLLR